MEYNKEIISNEEVADILNKAITSVENIEEGISKKNDVERILQEIEGKIKNAKILMKNMEDEIKGEQFNIEKYKQSIKDIHIEYTNDRANTIKEIIRANIADDIKTDEDIRFNKINEKEINKNNIYQKDNNKKEYLYLFKSIIVKKDTTRKNSTEEERYKCIGFIKIGNTDYEDDKEYNEIYIELENENILSQKIYDKYKVCPLINNLNNKLLYKDN